VSRLYDIDYLIDEVVTLPSLPGTVAHIMRLVSDPQCPLGPVAKAISADPPLAIKTLRLVNTAYYGVRHRVSTIEHAVVLLGTKVIKNLAFTATVLDIMRGGMGSLFEHSVCCGATMRCLAENGHSEAIPSGEEAFVYGLLHDIGKVILQEYLPEECRQVDRLRQTRGVPAYEAERAIFGVDHAQLGARLARKWNLSQDVVDGIGGHHDLSQCKEEALKPVAALVGVADYISERCGFPSAEGSVTRLDEEAWLASGLTSNAVPGILDQFLGAMPSLHELIKVAV